MNTKILDFLNGDGSLNVSKIRKLPLEEKLKVMTYMTQNQTEEYWSTIPINESQSIPIIISGKYNMEEDGVDALEFLEKMRKKYDF